MDTATFIERCDWAAVRADVVEHRAQVELQIAQINAEIRAANRPPKLREQEELASWRQYLDTAAAFLGVLDARGL